MAQRSAPGPKGKIVATSDGWVDELGTLWVQQKGQWVSKGFVGVPGKRYTLPDKATQDAAMLEQMQPLGYHPSLATMPGQDRAATAAWQRGAQRAQAQAQTRAQANQQAAAAAQQQVRTVTPGARQLASGRDVGILHGPAAMAQNAQDVKDYQNKTGRYVPAPPPNLIVTAAATPPPAEEAPLDAYTGSSGTSSAGFGGAGAGGSGSGGGGGAAYTDLAAAPAPQPDSGWPMWAKLLIGAVLALVGVKLWNDRK